MHSIFEWTHADVVAKDPILTQKAPYLNTSFFLIRFVIYFVIWSGLAYILSNWSRAQDAGYVAGSERKFRLVSGPGLLLYAVTATFASVDWIMSLDPHWFSTIFGLLFLIQHGDGGDGLHDHHAVRARRAPSPMAAVIKPINVHDCSKFLLAFVMIWAYFSFSQFLIIWSANLPEEIPWYSRAAEPRLAVGEPLPAGRPVLRCRSSCCCPAICKRNARRVAYRRRPSCW